MALRIEGAPGLERLLRLPQTPVTGRFRQAAPFGTNSYA
jgi:hypothetical protein